MSGWLNDAIAVSSCPCTWVIFLLNTVLQVLTACICSYEQPSPSFICSMLSLLLTQLPTLALYTSWLHILLALLIASFFWRPAAITLAALVATTLLPAKPLRWQALLQSRLFESWRRYFHFRWAKFRQDQAWQSACRTGPCPQLLC